MACLRSGPRRGRGMMKSEGTLMNSKQVIKSEARKQRTAATLGFAQQLRAKFGDLVSEPAEFRGEIAVKVSDAERMPEICAFAKNELGFDYLVDITSIDNCGAEPRDRKSTRL